MITAATLAPAAIASDGAPPRHPLLEQLVSRHGCTALDADAIDAFAGPGPTLLIFTEDPVRFKETLDLAVIAPEVVRAFGGIFRVGVLFPEHARRAAARYGFARWPALVVLRDGAYVGAIDGLRNWDEYLTEVQGLLAAPSARPPSVGIAVKSASAPAGGCSH
jgi:hydrogenase-1 operon protein HyaE